jgi:hypothetical protein
MCWLIEALRNSVETWPVLTIGHSKAWGLGYTLRVRHEFCCISERVSSMGVFFDRGPSPEEIDLLAEAYRHPRTQDADLDTQVGYYLRQLGGPQVDSVLTALRSPALADQQAHARARRTAVARASVPPPTTFHTARFVGAVLIFAALGAGGAVADAANLTPTSAALFGFAGSVFGVVTALLGSEKGT